ncbi:MAG: translation initiation factor IF-2 [Oceanicoccus sp.]|jgi:translation initiation factor IF-2
MAITLPQFASKLGLTEAKMKKTILELGFEADEEITDDVAELIMDELAGRTGKTGAELYAEESEVTREREIVKKQRKQMAGKGSIGKKRKTGKRVESTIAIGAVEVSDQISVKELAEKTGLSAAVLIGGLMKNGILANINQVIDFDTAVIITDGRVELKKKRSEGSAEDIFLGNLASLIQEDDKADLEERPPVVCVMGHVDHGKTTLLDALRDANVVEGESGGITQHIGAYQVKINDKAITFLDTPGHEAFTAMRARGARATDVAILVVAADDGVMPQTIEAINHAKDAGVPIVVAVNKMDRPGANPDRVKAELAEHGLQPEEWGGDTIMVNVSALKKQGLKELLESVILVSDVLELKANPDRPAVATVVESHLDPNMGPVATVLVNTGTLNIQDNFIVGQTYGRVKTMTDYRGKKVKAIGPSGTVKIAGLNDPVESGQILQVMKDERTARQRANKVQLMHQEEMIKSGMGMQEILQRIKEGSLKMLKIVVKADTQGSLEAIKQSLAKVRSDDVAIKVIHSGVGNISESDVMMGAASPGTLVLGFHTTANLHVRKLAERYGIEVVTYSVIYEIIEDLTKILKGMLEPEIIHVDLGRFLVKKIFWTGKDSMVVGGVINKGKLIAKCDVNVFRGEKSEHSEEQVPIFTGKIDGLKLVNEDIKELEHGNECGITFKGKLKLKEGDILEAWTEEKKMKTL